MQIRFYQILVMLLGLGPFVKGQDTLNFKFKVENHSGDDTSYYYGMEQEFTSHRVSLDADIFNEDNLLSRLQVDTFKKKNNDWEIKRNGKWEYFFTVKGFDSRKRSTVNIAGLDYYLSPGKKIKKKNRLLYELVATPKLKTIQVSSMLKYMFEKETGIVEIISSEITLVRQSLNETDQK